MEEALPQPRQYLGKPGEDPASPPWASGNYVGPYWSDGKLQSSVEWGEAPALHEIDEAARRHDAAYAHFKDSKHRAAADLMFAEEMDRLKGKYGNKIADDPRVAKAAVLYGNHIGRKASGFFSDVARFGGVTGILPAILKLGVENIRDSHQMTKGTYLQKERDAVKLYYKTDPRLKPEDSSGRGPIKKVEVQPMPLPRTPAGRKTTVAPQNPGQTGSREVERQRLETLSNPFPPTPNFIAVSSRKKRIKSQAARFKKFINLRKQAEVQPLLKHEVPSRVERARLGTQFKGKQKLNKC